ncbi:MAG TPA: uridylate kinase [Methanospirillum sp.]|uniref:uridylate kinase n=1 Tax=Methanospirillum sp. TaxID=45200 RepID=UPI002BAB503E|nr:uridylate kinase [Methanospirillum sp.]HWQ64196.1 uridylate kinase [Methanospirillum sp.]
MEKPLVIKIGGSLLPHARQIIRTILKSNKAILILPGGGIFADAVRETGSDGTVAHWMAIAGMEQYGWYLSGFGVETTRYPEFTDKPRVMLPYQYLIEKDPLPHTWDITSDTISAWLADYLGADLLILKSIDQVRADGVQIESIKTQINTSDLDPLFIPFILCHSVNGIIINGTFLERITLAMKGEKVVGTGFGTII